MVNRHCFFFLAGLLFTQLLAPPPSRGQAQSDIVRTDSIKYCRIGGVDLRLDMARPAQNNGPDPALIFIHGGGWKSGGRGQFYDEIGDAAQDGYVAVTITHRLTEPTTADGQVKYPWPAAIHDVKCSIRYLRANASRFHLDPHKIGITGHSSGGHLALMAGLTDKSDSLEGPGGHQEVSSRVQAVVSMSGVTAMSTFYYVPDLTPYVERLMGGAPDQYPERYMEASPVHYVSSDDPPVMSIHGEDDETVPIAQPKALDRAFEAFPVSHRLVILENQSHVYEGEGAQRAQRMRRLFFNQHLKE